MGCRWAFGDIGDADFHFCGKERVKDKAFKRGQWVDVKRPYCEEHMDIAYAERKKLAASKARKPSHPSKEGIENELEEQA